MELGASSNPPDPHISIFTSHLCGGGDLRLFCANGEILLPTWIFFLFFGSRPGGYGVISGDTVDINRRDVLVTGLAGADMN
eukprot:94141-Pelagomonas_calceolata.AAC.3